MKVHGGHFVNRECGVGVVFLFSLLALSCSAAAPDSLVIPDTLVQVSAAPVSLSPSSNEILETQARTDPLGFFRWCRSRYVETVTDYRCRFLKQELLENGLSAEQEMQVRFRENPYSVDMRWVKNADRAKRVSFVVDRWGLDGRQYALVEPSGLVGLLVPGGVKRDIHSAEVRASSRRSIEQFGFKNTLDLILKYSEMALGKPGYDLRYVGIEQFQGRPCYVFRRLLPKGVIDQPYPDRLLIVYVDCEWLVPTGCFSYADEAGRKLLGHYVLTSVTFNLGLTDQDF